MTAPPLPLVTVIIPAYNAADTIGETLLSVRTQTHSALEIRVVDDGSTDSTAGVVESHARADPRVALIRQSNMGVAAARNAAIADATGDYIAPIDADDLWHPQKIERQVAVMESGGSRVGLVYTWSAHLDEHSRVRRYADQYEHEGYVLKWLCEFNMVGNGSSPLMRADAVRQAGGYDASLVRYRAQGCEDWALYLAIAERFEFRVVPEYLTGYRLMPASMSSDIDQMWRSFSLVERNLRARRPDLAWCLQEGLANMCLNCYRKAKAQGRKDCAAAYLRHLYLRLPYHALKIFLYRPLRNALRRKPEARSLVASAGHEADQTLKFGSRLQLSCTAAVKEGDGCL